MFITLIIYISIFTIIICKAFYKSIPLIKSKPFSVKKNIENFSISLNIESLFFVSNMWKINLFLILIIFFISILSIIINNTIKFNFIIDILNNMHQNTYCAGVPKLIELANNEVYPNQLFTKNKILFKYNFLYLDRNKKFYIDRSTIIELHDICSELNLIYRENMNIFENILSNQQLLTLKTEKDVDIMLKRFENFYNENLFKRENLRLINTKLGIPLYLDLCNKAYIPFFFKYRYPFNNDILIDKIYPFLDIKLSKNVNYFNLGLIYNEKNLICLKSDFTVNAVTIANKKEDVVEITDRKILESELINRHKVISKVKSNTNQIIKVKDLECVCEIPNGQKKPDILVGGVGIIESYIYYFKCMKKTEALLTDSNLKIKELIIKLKNKEVGINEFQFNKKNSNFLDFYKTRIIENKMIPDPKKLFKKDQIFINPDICLKFNKINITFLKQLNKDPSMLRDIHNQQSGMQINYHKLIKIMKNPDKDIQQYFNPIIKNRILRASEGDFSLKRPRS